MAKLEQVDEFIYASRMLIKEEKCRNFVLRNKYLLKEATTVAIKSVLLPLSYMEGELSMTEETKMNTVGMSYLSVCGKIKREQTMINT